MTSNDSGTEVDGQQYADFSASPDNHAQNGQGSGVTERTILEDNATVIENIYDIENSKNEKEAKESRGLMAFCIVFGFGSLFSSSVQAYMSSQITVLERAFGMSSSTSGILLIANDIGFVATVLIASHIVHRYHIPRILGACILVFGVSGMLTSLPHFMMNEKMPSHSASLSNTSDNASNNLLCTTRSNNWTVQNGCDASDQGSLESKGDNKWVLAFIAIMLVVQGIAKSSRQPLSTIYVDNNAKREKTGFYIGILSTFSIFGPMIAITAGGLFSKLPVDLKETTLQPEDPRWIGAWWLGFIVFGACAVLVSLPVFCFPAGRRLPDQKAIDIKRSEHAGKQPEETCCHYFRDLPQSIIRVLSRPVYTLNLVAILFQMYSVLSLGAFGPKYIENQFKIPTWQANIILGPEKLVTTVLGTLGGGLLTRRLKLDTTGCVKLIVAARTISLFLNCFNFLFGCDNPPIVGLDSSNSRVIANTTCGCNGISYLPMCADGQTFFSPCHAGCQVQTEKGFTQCLGSTSGDVRPGLCDTSCYSLIPFIVTNAVGSLIGTLVIAPTYVVVLRSVRDKDRSMAVGLLSFLISLLVFLPAPIVYGKLFDSLCLAWTHSCTGKGACSLYDVTGMRVKFNATDIGLRLGSVLFTLLTLCCSRRELNSNTKYDQEKEMDPPSELQNKKQTEIKINGHSNAQPDSQRRTVSDNSDIRMNKKPLPVIPGMCNNKTNKSKEQEDKGYYINVDINPDDLGEIKRHKPLPAIPDKRPMPSPRLS